MMHGSDFWLHRRHPTLLIGVRKHSSLRSAAALMIRLSAIDESSWMNAGSCLPAVSRQ